MLVYMVCEAYAEIGAGPQRLENACRRVRVVGAEHIVAGAFEDMLGVPAQKFVSRVRLALARAVPVVAVVPIRVAAVLIDDQVIDQIVNVAILLETLILRILSGSRSEREVVDDGV